MKYTEWKNYTLLAASLAIVLMAIGCGRQESRTSASTPSVEKGATRVASSQTGGPREGAGAGLALASADGDGTMEETAPAADGSAEPSSAGGSDAAQAGSEPPDVVASIDDSLALPGTVVTVTATGSPDVVAMTLADGMGKPKTLTYDASANVWRTTYRVPLNTAAAKLGFSITATNAHKQWRRVWLFPSLEREEAAAEPDSAR